MELSGADLYGEVRPVMRLVMEEFIHRQNLAHLQQVLERTSDEAEQIRIKKLIAEEMARTERQDHREKAASH